MSLATQIIRNAEAALGGSLPIVVCVDDDPAILGLLRHTFRHEAVNLMTTTSPDEALSWVKTLHVAVLIADQCMPTMNGINLIHAATECSPHIATIMLTGYPDGDLVHDCMTCGANRLITKPWDEHILRRTVTDLVRESREELP